MIWYFNLPTIKFSIHLKTKQIYPWKENYLQQNKTKQSNEIERYCDSGR